MTHKEAVTPAPAAPVADMDALTSAEAFPEVKQNAIDAVKASQAEAPKPTENVTLKKDGTPAAKRGRKPKDENAQATQKKFYRPGDDKPTGAAQLQTISSEHAAKMASGTIEGLGVALLGPDWKYHEMERAANVQAWSDTFDYYGGVQLSPPQMLMLSHGAIILQRFTTSETTRTKAGLAKAWFKNKIANLKGRKKNALSDSGSNTERKDDIRKEEIAEPKKNAKQI